MRILHLVPTYFPATRYGGPIQSVHGLCAALARLGHDMHVYTTNVDGQGDSAVPLGQAVERDGVKVWYFPSKRFRRLYWSPEMARVLWRSVGSFDLVHTHSVFLWPTWLAARAAQSLGVPYVVSPRGMLVRALIRRKSTLVKSVWIELIERRNLERAAAIHVTSASEDRELQRFGFRLPMRLIVPNGVSLPDRHVPCGVDPEVASLANRQPLVLFLGRLNWKKGLDRLIPALLAAPAVHLGIVGNDEENYRRVVDGLVAQHALGGRVTILSRFVDGTDKAALLASAKVLVLPSYSENFGNVILEAMSFGCPVLVTPEVGAADLVRASGGGRVVDGEPGAFGHALQELVGSADRAKLGSQGRRYVIENLSWDAIAGRMECGYRDVLCAGRRAKAIVQ